MTPEQRLFAVAQRFIEQQNIFCAETIYQSDRVIVHAYEFIEQVCDIVGYAGLDDPAGKDKE